jgi:hypothetical protein
MSRLNTKLEAEGAEFLVLGHLLIRGIAAYKAYTNMTGYDLVATRPESNKSAMIQVKSRWRTNAPGFIIKNLDSDFVVVALLNRGSKDGKAEVRPPEYYVFPISVIKSALRSKDWGKINFSNIHNCDNYKDVWHLIVEFLEA